MGEMIKFGIKMALVISISLAFMTALTSLLSLITSVIFNNVIGEVLKLMSMCLPFDAASVLGNLGTATSAILAFLVAKKIQELLGQYADWTS